MARAVSALTQHEKALFLPSLIPTVEKETQATVDGSVVRWTAGLKQYTMDVGAGTLVGGFWVRSLREIVYVVDCSNVTAVLVFHFSFGRAAVKVNAASFLRGALLVLIVIAAMVGSRKRVIVAPAP
jgi:hypothetical protein